MAKKSIKKYRDDLFDEEVDLYSNDSYDEEYDSVDEYDEEYDEDYDEDYEVYEDDVEDISRNDNNGSGSRKPSRSSKSKRRKKKGMGTNGRLGIILVVEFVVLALMAAVYIQLWAKDKLSKINYVELDRNDLAINESIGDRYHTIAIFGVDSRDSESLAEGTRSDCIMIASIDKNTKKIKIVSVYRDSYLQIADGSGLVTKINAAYSFGGPQLAIKSLNTNLDLAITDFVTVNFTSLTMAIDDLGGVDINVEEDELPVLNSSITEQIGVTGINSDGVFETGLLHLNGTQATAYSRIRSTGLGDITRTSRQREVLSQMMIQAKKANLRTIDKTLDDVFPYMSTSLDEDDLIELAKELVKYDLGNEAGFPFSYYPYSHQTKGAILVPASLTYNVTALHNFLYDDVSYTPSSTVQGISDSIQNETGVGVQEVDIEAIKNPPEQ